MSSVRVVIFCSILLGLGMLGSGTLGCAQSPLTAVDDADLAPLQPGDADDDLAEDDDDPGPVDEGDDEDDEGDDEEPPSRDAATSAPRDAGMSDAMSPRPSDEDDDDAGEEDDPEPVVDAGSSSTRDASQPPAPDAGRDPVVDASAPPRDASTAPVDAGPSMPPVVACSAGTYRGTMTGTIRGGGDVRVTGTVTFVLSATGTSLRVQSGTFEGRDQGGQSLTARLSGVLNCATRRFESGALQDGVYDTRVGLVSPVRYEGTLGGQLNESTGLISGDWRWESALGTRDGTGTWTAMRAQ